MPLAQILTEHKLWKLLYTLASRNPGSGEIDLLFDFVGKTVIRETNYQAFHWHRKANSQFLASQNWYFRRNDLNQELTRKINEGDPFIEGIFLQQLRTIEHPKIIALDKFCLPFKEALILPVKSEEKTIAILEFFGEQEILDNKAELEKMGCLIVGEIERQLDLYSNQAKEKNQVVQLAQSSHLSSLGAMAGGIAHEINNPLTIIMGLLKIAIKDISQHDQVDRERLCDSLEKARLYTERISKIVKGIRALSRDGSKDPFILSKVQDIIDSTLSLCEVSVKNHSIQLTYDLEDAEQLIQCRPVQISQILLNLINNSMDAIGDQQNPWIHVSVRKINPTTIEFGVTDSGSGIPDAIADQLMNPFFTTKGAGKGTGLGLSISQEIVRAHSGQLTLDRKFPNTRFLIHVPIEQDSSLSKTA